MKQYKKNRHSAKIPVAICCQKMKTAPLIITVLSQIIFLSLLTRIRNTDTVWDKIIIIAARLSYPKNQQFLYPSSSLTNNPPGYRMRVSKFICTYIPRTIESAFNRVCESISTMIFTNSARINTYAPFTNHIVYEPLLRNVDNNRDNSNPAINMMYTFSFLLTTKK